MTALWLVLLMAAAPGAPAGDSKAAPEFKGPAQAARGRVVFLDESKSTHCSGCHALAHAGMAVGPDLSRLARLNPRAIVMAIRSTRTQYVQLVKLQDGSEFPGMPVTHDEKTAQYYDLGASPPALRKLDPKDIQSVVDNSAWKHPPESAGYTAEQLADVIAYIKWVAYGNTQRVDPRDME